MVPLKLWEKLIDVTRRERLSKRAIKRHKTVREANLDLFVLVLHTLVHADAHLKFLKTCAAKLHVHFERLCGSEVLTQSRRSETAWTSARGCHMMIFCAPSQLFAPFRNEPLRLFFFAAKHELSGLVTARHAEAVENGMGQQ